MDQKATPPSRDELFERSKKRKSSQFIMHHNINKTSSDPKAYTLTNLGVKKDRIVKTYIKETS